jgi:hypothetical protein
MRVFVPINDQVNSQVLAGNVARDRLVPFNPVFLSAGLQAEAKKPSNWIGEPDFQSAHRRLWARSR